MRKLLLVIILTIPLFAFAQTQADTIVKLPATGYPLAKGWKFQPGDDADWAAVNFNDSKWQGINPSLLIHDLPQVSRAQIGWFRTHLYVDSALRGKTVALVTRQIGASEIYVNGLLVKKYGRVSANYQDEKTYNPNYEPLTIQLNAQAEQVLAIRYSFNKQNWYAATGRSVLTVAVYQPDDAWAMFNTRLNRNANRSFVFGVFFILTILHFAIYLAYKSRKLNFYLACFTFLQSLTFIDGLMVNWRSNGLYEFSRALFCAAAPATFAYLLFMVYGLFGYSRPPWVKWLAYLAPLITVLQFFASFGEAVLIWYAVIIYGITIYVAIRALSDNKSGAVLFLIGQVTAFVFYCSFNLNSYYLGLIPFVGQLVLIDMAFLPPAIVISVLLAREFAQNNFSLQLQLKQVEELSAKNIEQEQEKQQILASQNELLEQQVNERTSELNRSLTNLKSAQAQLIQAEKMASLGELTAGIAHEIQNPLNFVNNFSEVSIELLSEMGEELDKGDVEEAKVISTDLKQNLEKINQHGKRADGIVKGMLEHSRAGSGERQLTDINQLADEFLKLAYHGMRAKDKDFNAGIVTNFDENLPKANIVQQDIGRVLLNLFNNAFYAVNEKKKTEGDGYTPQVTITTFTPPLGGWGAIVRDNGNGIPDAIKDKIMQPFFTTKPTGQGTGLGLSISYDIVVKGHGGKIDVQSREGEGSEFVVQIPG